MTFEADLVALYPALTRYAKRLKHGFDGVEDLVQDTLLLAWRKRDRFDGANLTAWALTLMHHINAEQTRITLRRAVLAADRPPPTETAPAPQEPATLLDEIARLMATAPRLYGALAQHALGWHDYEIAVRLDAPLGTIKSRLHRSRAALRAHAG